MVLLKSHRIVLILLISVFCFNFVKCGIFKNIACKTESQIIFDTIPEVGEYIKTKWTHYL